MLVPGYEIFFKGSEFFKNENEGESIKSRNLMPFFHVYLSMKPGEYCLPKIAKISTREISTSVVNIRETQIFALST